MPGPLDQKLIGVLGDRTAKALGRALDLHTVGDLVTHYPRRYQKRGELTRLDALPLETEVTVVADVLRAGSRSMMNRRGSRQEVLISDGSGTLTLVFFNQPFRVDPSKAGALKPGVRGMFSGRVRFYKGMRELTHPRYELFDGSGDEPPDPEVDPEGAKAWHEVPIPIYPASAAHRHLEHPQGRRARAREHRRHRGPDAARDLPHGQADGLRAGAAPHPPAAARRRLDAGEAHPALPRGVPAADGAAAAAGDPGDVRRDAAHAAAGRAASPGSTRPCRSS